MADDLIAETCAELRGYNHEQVFNNWCPGRFQAAIFELDVSDLILNTLHSMCILITDGNQVRT